MPKTDAQLPYDFFISYSQADRAWVEGYLLDALTLANVRVHSELNFAVGAPRITEFERAIQQSKRTLLILSPAYLSESGANFVNIMVQYYGLESGTWPVIPLLLAPVELPPRLAFLVCLDATQAERWPEVITRLCQAVQVDVPAPARKPPCPYPGMRAFRAEEAVHFHGRDREIETLLQRLRLNPLMAIIGASGSGKSSLVFAGLLPALQRSQLFGAGDWLVRTMRPGAQPLTELKRALNGLNVEQFTLSPLLASQEGATRLLLIIDQFEELFTQAASDAATLFASLQHYVAQPGCYLVLTLRADFFDQLLSSPFWSMFEAHRIEIAPLSASGLREAIVKPAEEVGVFIESALVERLVAGSVGQPGLLPFMQEVMVRLWEKLERRYLPLRAYEALVLPLSGYSGSERSGIQAAMAQLADEMINRLAPEQQQVTRRIFLRLVQFGEGRDDTRRQQPISALRAAGEDTKLFDRTLSYLVENRLIVLSGDETSESRVDLAHEAMLTGWPRLGQWIRESKEAELVRRRLEQRALEWKRFDGRGGLLDEHEIAEISAWLDPLLALKLELSNNAHRFVVQSQQQIRKRRNFRRIGWVLAAIVIVPLVTILLFTLTNFFVTRALQSEWQLVNAPAGQLSAIASDELAGGEHLVIGSYDYGVSYRQDDGTWTDWLAGGLPHSSPSTTTHDPTSFIRTIQAIVIDSVYPYTITIWVVDGGIYQWMANGQMWQSIGSGIPINTLANIPLAAQNGILLAAADDLALYVRLPGEHSWHNLVLDEPMLAQQVYAVAFGHDGSVYVSGSSGFFRGRGEYPWQWQQLKNIPLPTLFALDEQQNIYAIAKLPESRNRPQLLCFDRDGNQIGKPSTLPVSDFLLSFLQVSSIHSVVAAPHTANKLYAADNFGAIYEANCAGEWHKIGQQPVVQTVPSTLAMQKDASADYFLLWASKLGLMQRKIE